MSQAQAAEIDVKTAVRIAKDYVQNVFSADGVKNVGLEEVSFNEVNNEWDITIGFSRPWDEAVSASHPSMSALNAMFPDSAARTYKVISVSALDGAVSRMAIRSI